MKTVDSHLSKV